ncbi:hypothetical protein SAMN06265380_102412, partial [Ruegeria faecimaris]
MLISGIARTDSSVDTLGVIMGFPGCIGRIYHLNYLNLLSKIRKCKKVAQGVIFCLRCMFVMLRTPFTGAAEALVTHWRDGGTGWRDGRTHWRDGG